MAPTELRGSLTCGLRLVALFVSNVVLASGALHAVSETFLRPTAQPATHGQDLQDCGYTLLPDKVELAPKSTGGLAFGGAWESMDGATFLAWQEALTGFARRPTLFTIGPKLFVKAVPVTGIDVKDGKVDAVQLLDCAGTLMYELWVDPSRSDFYEIYNTLGELIARSVQVHGHKGRLLFSDELDKPLAYAQSPFITKTDPATDIPSLYAKSIPPHEELGAVKPYQLWFYPSNSNSSSLTLAQNRWVVAAAVQDYAIREALIELHSMRSAPVAAFFAVAPILEMLTFVLIMATLFYILCVAPLTALVYSDEGGNRKENPFLVRGD